MSAVPATFGIYGLPGAATLGSLSAWSPLRERLNHVPSPCPINVDRTDEMNRTDVRRNFRRKTGRNFQSAAEFAEWSKEALGRTFGYGTEAHKRTAETANTTVYSARNWGEGRNGMQAHNLRNLLAESDELLAEFLENIGRSDLADAARRDAVLDDIKALLAQLEARQ